MANRKKADKKGRLAGIPSVSSLLNHPVIKDLTSRHGRELVTYAIRSVVDRTRAELQTDGRKKRQPKDSGHKGTEEPGPVHGVHSLDSIVADIKVQIHTITESSLLPVINATGVVLHTNLGRAPLSREITEEVVRIVEGYSNLEYDLKNRRRGDRNRHFVDLLVYLTSAEDAIVVNNNAAGIMLTLNTLASGREVIVSRGELVEIGGSFRIPDIIDSSGVKMVEVGTTNKTHLADYERAINPETAMLFKAHNSNYRIIGFTESVSVKTLSDLAHTHNLPLVYDLGSGLLRKFKKLPADEPNVRSALDDGADLVLFSCDKLLGGPQAGIVAGKKTLIRRLSQSPLMRVLRVGKLTLAALSAACRMHLDEEQLLRTSPTLSVLKRNLSDLNALASKLAGDLEKQGVPARITDSTGQFGGGSLPGVSLNSVAVEILPKKEYPDGRTTFSERLFQELLNLDRPILGILRQGKLLFDVLVLHEKDLEYMTRAISDSVKSLTGQNREET